MLRWKGAVTSKPGSQSASPDRTCCFPPSAGPATAGAQRVSDAARRFGAWAGRMAGGGEHTIRGRGGGLFSLQIWPLEQVLG